MCAVVAACFWKVAATAEGERTYDPVKGIVAVGLCVVDLL